MTDIIEQKMCALVGEVRAENPRASEWSIQNIALCRAIEQHEAFRQEVSDAVEGYNDLWRKRTPGRDEFMGHFIRFIIAKPDPLDEAVKEAASKWMNAQEPLTDGVRAAIEKRGGKIVWGEG